MDFTNRSTNQPQPASNTNNAPAPSQHGGHSDKKSSRFKKIKDHRLLHIVYVALLFCITILVVAVVSSIFLFDGNRNKESKLVDTSKYQAVFLNGGQVYFGKITDINSQYMSLADIYYLTPNQAVQSDDKTTQQPTNFTIKKLGCELHRPQNVMVINHDQIIFWENLKDDGNQNTVPGAIKKLSEQDQNCEQQSQSSSNSNNASNNNSSDSTAPAAGTGTENNQ